MQPDFSGFPKKVDFMSAATPPFSGFPEMGDFSSADPSPDKDYADMGLYTRSGSDKVGIQTEMET